MSVTLRLSLEFKKKRFAAEDILIFFLIILLCFFQGGARLDCLDGMRAISMTWVILGHTFYFSLPYIDNPVWALNTIQNSWTMEAVEQGLFSVDSFFFLSGLLVSYIFLKRRSSVDQLTSPLTWVKVTLHRYVRLLPPYMALVLLLEPLSFYTCSGPQVVI